MEQNKPRYKCRCIVCGTDFDSYYMTAKFCGDECRESAQFSGEFGSEEVSRIIRSGLNWVDASGKKSAFDKLIDATTPEQFIADKKKREIEKYARVIVPEEILRIQEERKRNDKR